MKKFLSILVVALMLLVPVCFCACSKSTYKIDITPSTIGTVTASLSKASKGETITLSSTCKNGYELGHYIVDGNSIEGNSFTMPSKDVKVSASFSPITYHLTYHTDEQTQNTNPKTYTVESQTFNLNAPYKKGYYFVAWYSNSQLTQRVDFIQRGTYGDMDLYPRFEKVDYKIMYELDGGQNSNENPLSYNFDDGIITLKNASKSGFEFKGWFLDKTFTQRITQIDCQTTQEYTLYAKFISTQKVDDYLLITSPQDLIALIESDSLLGKYRLANDINMADYVLTDFIGSADNHFTGEFDGNNFKIENIKSNNSTLANIGLFGVVENAIIKNLTISVSFTAYPTQEINIGSLVGESLGTTTIENCHLLQSSLIVRQSDTSLGGLVGRASTSTTISKCSATDLIIYVSTPSAFVGGIVGNGGSLSQCYFDTNFEINITANSTCYFGGLVGYSTQSTIENCFFTSTKAIKITSQSAFVGGLVGKLGGASNVITMSYASLANAEIKAANLTFGGLAAELENCNISSCFVDLKTNSSINLESNSVYKIGYVAAETNPPAITNCFATDYFTLLLNGAPYSKQEFTDQADVIVASREFILDSIEFDDEVWDTSSNQLPTLRS